MIKNIFDMKKLILTLLSLGLVSCASNILTTELVPLEENNVNSSSFFGGNNNDYNFPKVYPKFYNQKYPVTVIAHRGYRDVAPENTMSAFRKAYQIGVNMVELDVSLTKDREVAIMHDDTIDRTTNGKGNIEDKTLAELKELDAGSWFSPVFKGEQVPTLGEVLEFAKDKICVNIEIKSYTVEKRSQTGIEAKVVELIKKYDMKEHVLVSSFSQEALRRIKVIDPSVPTALLIVSDGIFNSQTSMAKKVNSDAINELYNFTRGSEIEKSQKNNLKVNVWTINDPHAMSELIDKKVDGLITDRPDLALKVLADKFGNKN